MSLIIHVGNLEDLFIAVAIVIDDWCESRLTKVRLFFLIPIVFEMTKLMRTLHLLLMIVVNGAWQTRNTENLLANPSKLRSCHFSLKVTKIFKSIYIFYKWYVCFGEGGHYAFRLQPLECSTAYYSDVRMGHVPFHAIEDGAMEIFKKKTYSAILTHYFGWASSFSFISTFAVVFCFFRTFSSQKL